MHTNLASESDASDSSLTCSVYFAGDLWSHKDLFGNALLAEYIAKVSGGRYVCALPQDLETPVNRGIEIRNGDLKQVITSDLAVFNFDGANLDAGTVVEFCVAKMLDIPCVLLRTDFRSAGEGNADQEPWNLMATGYPRSQVLIVNGMAAYQNARGSGDLNTTISRHYDKLAGEIVAALDAVRVQRPIAEAPRVSEIFAWALQFPGGGLADLFSTEEVGELIAAKRRKGLLN